MSAVQLGAIVDLIADGTISGKIAKEQVEIVFTEGGDPRAIVDARGIEAGDRHRRHRGSGRRHYCRQSRQGGAGAGRTRTMLHLALRIGGNDGADRSILMAPVSVTWRHAAGPTTTAAGVAAFGEDDLEQLLGDLAGDGATGDQVEAWR